jgi:RHH-type transcriptional regulator, proline utilization regulon repressor / proline dehydrogenase / delta 1-pyrroline-5-carboxylate dehydrogenase
LPQFASHNGQTLATINHTAGSEFSICKYEFQCLHGMGEPLYEEVAYTSNLNRPCRIYAPVCTDETLLAYLVKRLLENGVNPSFENRISDPNITLDELVADPAEVVLAMPVVGLPHDQTMLPEKLFGKARPNSRGLDLSNEETLKSLSSKLTVSAATQRHGTTLLADGSVSGTERPSPILLITPTSSGQSPSLT